MSLMYWGIGVAIIGLILLIIGVVLYFVYIKPKETPSALGATNTPSNTEKYLTYGTMILGGILLFIGIILIVWGAVEESPSKKTATNLEEATT